MRSSPNLVFERLHEIREFVGLDNQEFGNFLGIDPKLLENKLLCRRNLLAPEVERITAFMNLSFEDFMSGRIDLKVLSSRFLGSEDRLPERYRLAAKSKRRTSIHLINTIEKKGGAHLKKRLLRFLQVDEGTLLNPDREINILFVMDVCRWLGALGLDDSMLFEFGRSSYYQNRNTQLGKALSNHRSLKDLLEVVFLDWVSKHFDQNCDYSLSKLNSEIAVVKAVPNEEVSHFLRPFLGVSAHLGSTQVCAAKAGSFSSLSGYLALPFMQVEEKRCIHRGDPACEFYFKLK